MNDNQIAIYCEAIRDTTIRQFYKIQNQRKEISMLHKKCKSQQAEIERLQNALFKQEDTMQMIVKERDTEIERLEETKNRLLYNLQAVLDERADHSEAVKECIEKIKSKAAKCVMTDNGIPVAGSASYSISEVELYKIEKEMVGENNAPCN